METGRVNSLLNDEYIFCFSYLFVQSERICKEWQQTEKLEAATRYHDKVGMLDTHLNKDEVDVMVKNDKTFFRTSKNQF